MSLLDTLKEDFQTFDNFGYQLSTFRGSISAKEHILIDDILRFIYFKQRKEETEKERPLYGFSRY